MNFKSIIPVFLLMFCFNLFAASTGITGAQCIDARLDAIADSLLDYDNYHTIDDEMPYDIDLLGIFKAKLTEAIKSKGTLISQTPTTSKYLVQMAFRPFTLTDAKLFPRFNLICRTNGQTTDRFAQKCQLVNSVTLENGSEKQLESFAMKNFNSLIIASANSPRCKNKGTKTTLIEYKATIETVESDVAKIKSEIVNSSPTLLAVINTMFNDEAFFNSYFEKLYKLWFSSL